MMSEEASKRIGQQAQMLVESRGRDCKMWVSVRILDCSTVFGRTVLTVVPVAGTGQLRVNEDSLKNFTNPKP